MNHDVEQKSCSFCGEKARKGTRYAGGFGPLMCESCVDHYYELLHSAADPDQEAHKSWEARPPWESMSDAQLLANIPLISQTADQVDDFLVQWVGLARSRKISWAEIGRALGTSRQAAWERFAQRVEASGASASSA